MTELVKIIEIRRYKHVNPTTYDTLRLFINTISLIYFNCHQQFDMY